MAKSFAQLEKKLRGESLREIRVRAEQKFAKLNERLFAAGSVELTEAELKARGEDRWVSGQRESAPVALFEAKGEGPQQFVSVLIPPKPCTGGALWPPCIEEGPRDAQERVATEGRPYGYFLGAGVVCFIHPQRYRDIASSHLS